MTNPLSRMGFNHPVQGAPGDATLYSNIETIYQTIGDAMPFRWFLAPSLANGAELNLVHSLNLAFSELTFRVYTYTGTFSANTTALTRVKTGFTVAADGTNPTTTTDFTNTSGGTLSYAILIGQMRYAEQLSDLSDVNTAGAQDGQALVYSASLAQFVPGASGDASFKLQSITSDVLTLKGGHIMLADGRELATYDGTNYGVDETVNLLTLLATPVNGTTYYLYVDLNALGSAVLDESVNRRIYGVTVSQLVLSTTTPDQMNLARYVPIGLVVGIASNHYSTTLFKTMAVRFGDNKPVAASLVSSRPVTGQAVGSVGSSGQIAYGHILTTKSWPNGLVQASQLAYFNLDADALDDGPQGKNLTNNASTPFTAANIFGAANTAALLNGTTQYFSSTDAFFNPGNGVSFGLGGWFKTTNLASGPTFLSNYASGSDRGFLIEANADGSITFSMTNTASVQDFVFRSAAGLIANSVWHHIAMVFDFGNQLMRCYVDGKQVGSLTVTNQRSLTSSSFKVGADSTTPADFFAGSIEDVFFVSGYTLTDNDIRKIASYRYDHNSGVLAKNQRWGAKIYPIADGDSFQAAPGWLVGSSDINSVFWDFSDLGSTDTVDVYLEDLGLAPALVSPQPPFDNTYTSDPSGTVAHGQPDVPEVLVLQEDGTAGEWVQLDPLGLVSADATNLKITTSHLTVGASPNRLRIIARSTRTATTGVPDATTGRSGVVTTSAQTFAGVKTFQDGAVIKGVTDGSSAAAGYVGEVISATMSQTIVTSNDTETDITGASLPLTAGDWVIRYGMNIRTTTSVAASSQARARVTTAANAYLAGSASLIGFNNSGGATNFAWVESEIPISIAASTTYKLRLTVINSAGTTDARAPMSSSPFGAFSLSPDTDFFFYAVRKR